MAQHDYIISNATGAAVRSDLNGALGATVSNNSGATEPATMYAYQWWPDTTSGLLKQRNSANSAWITIGTLGSANLGLLSLAGGTMTGALAAAAGTAALPGIAFTGDLDSGVFSAGANQFNIATNGVERVEFGASEVVFNDGGVDYDFRVEGDTKANLFLVDASADAVLLDGDLTLKGQADLRFADSDSSNYIAFQAPASIAADVLWTLPATDGTAGQVISTNGSGTLSWATASGMDIRNGIINGDFPVAQRGTSFTSTGGANNDDTYALDRWYILSDGNDAIDVTQETSTVPTNQKYAIALDVETINKKFGIAQIIESANCVGLTGGNATLSFKAKVSSTTKLDNVKAAIVAWSGTADTVTSDIISAWGAEGTNPTLIANATYENTPANLSVTTSYATYSLTANIDTASTKNIIVFIWSDVTDTTLGDFLYITDVQLETGAVATSFDRRPIGIELALCQRYFLSSTTTATLNVSGSTANVSYVANFPVTMRAAPTIVGVTASFTTTDNFTSFANTAGASWAGNNAYTASIEL